MILFSNFLVPKGYTGMTIFPFIFIKSKRYKNDLILFNHEKIHLKQQLEMLIIPFYLFYFIEYGIRIIQYRNLKLAYRNISFEREAYAMEGDLSYIKTRPIWNFLKYLRSNDFQCKK